MTPSVALVCARCDTAWKGATPNDPCWNCGLHGTEAGLHTLLKQTAGTPQRWGRAMGPEDVGVGE